MIFLGNWVPVFREKIESDCKVSHHYAPAHVNRQRAGAVAALGTLYYKEGKVQNARDHQPEYLRLSQEERERLQREKKNCEEKK